MSISEMNQLILTFTYIIIIVLLLVIRNYQKKLKKAKEDRILITKTLNTFNPNNLEELNKNYQILIKLLDNIQNKSDEKKENKKYDEEIG